MGPPLQEHNPHAIAAVLQTRLQRKYGDKAPVVAPKFSGPQVDTYTLMLSDGLLIEDVERLSRTLGIDAGANAARIEIREDGDVELQIPRPPHARRVLFASAMEDALRAKYGPTLTQSPFAVPLGIDMGGQAVWLDLNDATFAHILLSGVTGTGKSVLGKWLLYRLLNQTTPDQLRVLAADPKKRDPKEGLFFFRRAAHLMHPIVDTTQETVDLLRWVRWKINDRKASGERWPRILVFLEEVSYFADESPEVQFLLDAIMKIARGYNITILATTQKPGVDALGKAIANFTFTVSGRVARGNSAHGATGRGRTGADRLLGKGDFVALYPGDVTVRFQAPYIGPEHLAQRVPAVPKGEKLPRLNLAEAVTPDAPPPQAWRAGRKARDLAPEDYEEMKRMLAAGRGVHALVQRFGIGTTRATELARTLASEIEIGRGRA